MELIVQMALLEPIRKSSEDLVLHARSLGRSRLQVDGIQMVKITLKVERIEFAMHGNESHRPSQVVTRMVQVEIFELLGGGLGAQCFGRIRPVGLENGLKTELGTYKVEVW